MKSNIITIFLIAILSISLMGQDRISEDLRNDLSNDLKEEMTTVTGYFDQSMPFQLLFTEGIEECNGALKLSDLEPLSLEGECSDSTVTFYEFDNYARVSGVISGTRDKGRYDLEWSNYNHTKSYALSGSEAANRTGEVKIYQIKLEGRTDQLMLWPDNQAVKLSNDENLLKWCDYTCPTASYACVLVMPDGSKEDMSISDRMVSVGSELYEYKESVVIKNRSGHMFDHFYNFRYPFVGEEKFDSHIEDVIAQQLLNYQKALPELGSDEEWEPSDRLENKAIGDFYISLVTEDIISGYLTFYSTTEPRTSTITFTFDRNKKKFYKIREIWRKDFNFSYFLKSLLENQKRAIIAKEGSIIRKLLKDVPFTYYNLTEQGIVFFTDYNFIYGRRHILIPYDEISGFIDDKSLSNFIKGRT